MKTWEIVAVRTQDNNKLVGWHAVAQGEVKGLFSTQKAAKAFLDTIEVERRNLMTGKMVKESLTTPYYCSVSSETYWSS